MAVYEPCAGVAPDAMAMAIESGSATMATVEPGDSVRSQLGHPVAFSQYCYESFGVNSSAKLGASLVVWSGFSLWAAPW